MLYLLSILEALSDPSKLLHLTRGDTAQHDSFVTIKIGAKMKELLPSVPFFIGIFLRQLIGFLSIAHFVSTIDS